MTKKNLSWLLVTVAAVSTGIAQAQSLDGKWQPYSNTASSITGPVTFKGTQITFAGSKKPMVLDLRLVETRGGRNLYEVIGSRTGAIPLLNGNSLCSKDELPTYIQTGLRGSLLIVGVSADGSKPSLDWKDDLPSADCGVYNYSR